MFNERDINDNKNLYFDIKRKMEIFLEKSQLTNPFKSSPCLPCC